MDFGHLEKAFDSLEISGLEYELTKEKETSLRARSE
jgi:hypothetical protein